jgi:hypothetical protein
VSRHFTGGCACGSLRYEARTEPVFQNHCQCRDCQRRSGSGHGSYLTFAGRSLVDVTGAAATWRVEADSGNEKTHAFCPVCGAPVYLTFAAMPDLIAVHAASLDEPERFRPQLVTYAVRALPWDWTDPTLPTVATMPG